MQVHDRGAQGQVELLGQSLAVGVLELDNNLLLKCYSAFVVKLDFFGWIHIINTLINIL